MSATFAGMLFPLREASLLFASSGRRNSEDSSIQNHRAAIRRSLRSELVRSGGLVAMLICGVSGDGEAQPSPLTLPLHDPAYVQLEGLHNSGCAAGLVSPYRPYTVDRIREAIDEAGDDRACPAMLVRVLRDRFGVGNDSVGAAVSPPVSQSVRDGLPLQVGGAATLRATALGRNEFRPLWRDLRAADEGDPPVVATLRVRGRFAPSPRVALAVEAYGQSHLRNDPTLRARALRSTSGAVGISEATVAGAFGPVVLSFGRDREAWLGRGMNSIALAANGPPLDRLAASLVFGRFEGRALYAVINDVVLDTLSDGLPSGTPAQRFHRSVIGHALTWRPGRSFEVTIGETILISRGSRTLEFGYANPLMPYILTQNDADRDGSSARDNLLLFASATGRAGSARLTGELLIDDLQLDEEREVTPNQLAWRLDARYGFGSRIPLSIGAEYERVDGYTYLRGLYTDVYQFNDHPLGSELGPDSDRLLAVGEAWLNDALRVSTSVGVWRRGAQRIARRPARGAVNAGADGFLTTTAEDPFVQRAMLGTAAVEFLRPLFPVVLAAEAARIDHPDHTSAGAATYVRAYLKATYAFRYP